MLSDVNLSHEFHGQGKHLVFISGYLTSRLSWRDFWRPMTQSLRILTLDNRGMGLSQGTDSDYSIFEMACDVIALLDHYKIEKASFYGHSMGGAVVQEIGRHFRNRVDKIIIASSFAKFPTHAAYQINAFEKLKEYQIPKEKMIDLSLPWLFGETFLNSPEHMQNEIEARIKNPFVPTHKSISQQKRALLSFNSYSWLKDINVPTLIMAGVEDLYVPLRFSQELQKGIPNSLLFKINGAGHGIHVENPKKVITKILEFIN